METLQQVATFEPHLHHLAAVACILLTIVTTSALLWCLHTRLCRGQADSGPPCPTGPAGAGIAGSAAAGRLQALHFVVLILGMGVALHAEQLVAAAAELRLHPAVVGFAFLGVAALFNLAIRSVHFLVVGRSGEGEPKRAKTVLGATASAEAAPTAAHAPRPQPHHFIVVCLAMGAALNAEQLVARADHLGAHSGIVACFVLAATALFNWEILSLNLRVGRRAVERERKMLLPRPAASTVRSPHAARREFGVVAALVSASWFVEPLVTTSERCLPKAATAVVVLLFAALFNFSTHVFRSTFSLPCSPSFGSATAQRQNIGASTAGVISVVITIVACLVGALGSAYD